MKLDNKTILITGANRGIGRSLAEELANYPVNLLLGMRKIADYKPIVKSKALSVRPVKIDLSSNDSIDTCLKDLPEKKDIDILINNAGQFVGGPLDKQDFGAVSSMVQVNLNGLMYLSARLLPYLLKRDEAKIINNASIAGLAFFPYNSSYSATKAGVVAFSQSLRRELKNTNVSVMYSVTPAVSTEMMSQVKSDYKEAGVNLGLNMIPAEFWSKQITKAIQNNKKVLHPRGLTRVVEVLAKHSPLAIDLVSSRLISDKNKS